MVCNSMALKALEYSYKDDQKGFLKWEKQIMKSYSDNPIIVFYLDIESGAIYTKILRVVL